MVYFAEKDNPEGPWSFLDSFWWGLMTLTTVGYGDLSPHTFPGKLIGKDSMSKKFQDAVYPIILKISDTSVLNMDG